MVVDATPDADHDCDGVGLDLFELDDEDEVDKLRRAALALEHGALAEAYVESQLTEKKLRATLHKVKRKRNNRLTSGTAS